MKTILIAALALVALATVPARAANDPFKGTDCKSEELNQGQLDYCAGKTYEAADAKLNALYKELMAKYDAPNAGKLKKAEVAWIAFRDAECDYETNGTAGGSINPMENTICGTAKTNTRIAELTAQLKCEEGDLLCNMPVQ